MLSTMQILYFITHNTQNVNYKNTLCNCSGTLRDQHNLLINSRVLVENTGSNKIQNGY